MAETKRGRLLIVDDEVELKNALCETLADEGYETVGASSGAEGLKALEKQDFDLLLSDLMMPGMDGIQLLRKALEIDPNLVGIIMTGQGTIPSAVEAMKVGAFDYVLKPFNFRPCCPSWPGRWKCGGCGRKTSACASYVERLSYESPRYQMIGSGPAMQKVVQMIEKVAPTDATVLVRGRSGTGKELVARALHHNSLRRDRPLVTINCAALQESLLESELFGHEKGAFTGALQAKAGLIEVAEGGTLFIDEVAEMAPALQAKLLRVLEDGHYRRVGGTKECHADVRVIAATNKPLEEEQKAGRFREDLFYRLNVVSIDLPPLRERREDIPALVEHLLTSRQLGKVPCKVDPDAMRALLNYQLAWEHPRAGQRAGTRPDPGRRQSHHAGRLARNHAGGADLSGHCQRRRARPLNLSEMERRTVQAALQQAKGNKVHAAKALGISRRSLYRLIEKYHLESKRTEGEENLR